MHSQFKAGVAVTLLGGTPQPAQPSHDVGFRTMPVQQAEAAAIHGMSILMLDRSAQIPLQGLFTILRYAAPEIQQLAQDQLGIDHAAGPAIPRKCRSRVRCGACSMTQAFAQQVGGTDMPVFGGLPQAGNRLRKHCVAGVRRRVQQGQSAFVPKALQFAARLRPAGLGSKFQFRDAARDIRRAADSKQQAAAEFGASMGIAGLGREPVGASCRARVDLTALALFQAFAQPGPGLGLTFIRRGPIPAQGFGAVVCDAIAAAMGMADHQVGAHMACPRRLLPVK